METTLPPTSGWVAQRWPPMGVDMGVPTGWVSLGRGVSSGDRSDVLEELSVDFAELTAQAEAGLAASREEEGSSLDLQAFRYAYPAVEMSSCRSVPLWDRLSANSQSDCPVGLDDPQSMSRTKQ